MIDFIWYALVLTLVCIMAWLHNREINKSIEQARKSEKLLAGERDIFEDVIRKRTKELIESERMRSMELEKNARFGELSRGLFHDLMNPLSSLTLFIENMTAESEYSSDETRDMINKTIAASRRMESFMNSIRHATTETTETDKCADLATELSTVYDLLAYKARMAGIEIIIGRFNPISIKLNPFRLHQLFLNLVSNALDACIASMERYKQNNMSGIVKILAAKDKRKIEIIIKDNGCGISENKIDDIFSHPFTTKSKGTGIGLITVKKIMNEELHGTISMNSKENEGTICTITIPILGK